MQTVDPLNARQWFTWREPIAWGISIVVFIGLFLWLTIFFDGLSAFLIALIPTFLLFFFYLDKRAIGIECPHCQKYIETNTPWICGNKDTPHRNDQVNRFPFIYQCQHCGFIPKAYQCHHCFKLIFLSEDKQVTAYAKCADIPARPPKSKPVKKDEYADAMAKQHKEIQATELKVKKAELDVKLKNFDEVLNPPKEKSAAERLKTRFGRSVEVSNEERRLRAAIDEEFKNDPIERERRHKQLDDEVRSML
jgi:hypothetical protein